MIGMEFSMWYGAPTAEEFLIGLNIRLVKEYSKVLDAWLREWTQSYSFVVKSQLNLENHRKPSLGWGAFSPKHLMCLLWYVDFYYERELSKMLL